MNKFQAISLGFAVVFALSFVACQGAVLPDTRPLVEVEVRGDKYSAPVFEDVQFSEERKKFDRETVANMFIQFRKMIKVMMVQKGNFLSVGRAAINVMPTAYKSAQALKELQKSDKSPDMAKGYCNKMGDVLLNVLAAKSDEKLDDVEAKRRVDGMMDAIEEMAAKSPVGMYLDWSKFTVNGQPLVDYYAPAIRWFRDHRYGLELKLFEKLAGLIKRFSSGKSIDAA